jgi:hypothetical protein
MESHPIVGSHNGRSRLEAAAVLDLMVPPHDLFSWATRRDLCSAHHALDS